MPVFDWTCPTCDVFKLDMYQPRLAQEAPACAAGHPMVKVWSISGRSGGQVWPYVTSNITGSPIEVRGPDHLRELQKVHGVRLRDDAAFIEKSVEATGKGPVWREGSGRGVPGGWI